MKQFNIQEKRIGALRPDVRLAAARGRVREAHRSIVMAARAVTALRREQVGAHVKRLEALGPRQALIRGYTLTLSGGGIVRSVKDLKDRAALLMADGYAEVEILDRKEGDPFERYQRRQDEL